MPDTDYSNVYLVFLNGPPGCGKDSGAKELVNRFRASDTIPVCMKFAEPLKRSVLVDAGLPYDSNLEDFEAEKDVPKAIWGGVSFRQRCIIKSETYFKPQFGEEIFGELFLKSLDQKRKALADLRSDIGIPQDKLLVLVTDSGFESETRPPLRRVPHDNGLHVRIHAEGRGKTFEGDSRSYVKLPDTVKVVDVENNEPTPEGFQKYVGEVTNWILGTFDF